MHLLLNLVQRRDYYDANFKYLSLRRSISNTYIQSPQVPHIHHSYGRCPSPSSSSSFLQSQIGFQHSLRLLGLFGACPRFTFPITRAQSIVPDLGLSPSYEWRGVHDVGPCSVLDRAKEEASCRMDRAMAQHDHCPDDVAHGFVKQEIWQARLSLSQQNHDRESEKTIEMVL